MLTICVLLSACGEPLPDNEVDEIVYVDQGWSPGERLVFYYTPQGTQLYGLRYSWFINLNRPFSEERFADPNYLAKLGFLVDPCQESCVANPGNLPVGFTQHVDADTGEALLDITCAACHTGEIQVGGKAIRIDGGQAMHAFTSTSMNQFGPSLIKSMMATYVNPFEFDRFARRVLSSDYPESKGELRKAFGDTISGLLAEFLWGRVKGLYNLEEGYGRTDAIGRIGNTVFGEELDRRNLHVADAPVNYPYLWDIWKFDWVQYTGSAAQPMARNVGEALGVKAKLAMVDADGKRVDQAELFESSALVPEIHCLETLLQQLRPPIWDEAILGPIDFRLTETGYTLFKKNCRGCHGPHVYEKNNQLTPLKPTEWRMTLIPLEEIGTDPNTADNLMDNRFNAAVLNPGDPVLGNIAAIPGLQVVTEAVIKREYDNLGLSSWEREIYDGFGREIAGQELRCYKARPLHGVWATPPFLHNGSVRTVYQLLSPVEKRDVTFRTGTRQYDPVQLGYKNLEDDGGLLFDTTETGNANTGHQFRNDGGSGVIGRALTHEERMAIIEYLKIMGNLKYDLDYDNDYPDYGLPVQCPDTLQGPAKLLKPAKDYYAREMRNFCGAGYSKCQGEGTCAVFGSS